MYLMLPVAFCLIVSDNREVVPKKGLEPPHPCGYMDLNHARLPIPPLRQAVVCCDDDRRLEGKTLRNLFYKARLECQTLPHGCGQNFPGWWLRMAGKATTGIKQKEADEIAHLRALSHDLSNSLEAILQACYLLGQTSLADDGKRWVQIIDSSSQEAARLNREIRKLLRTWKQ